MSKERVERRLAAILQPTSLGIAVLWAPTRRARLRPYWPAGGKFLDPKMAEHWGRVVTTTGDGFLVEFASVVDATLCALDVQRGVRERNISVPQDKRLEFRIGINVGDVIIEDGDIFGDGVNVASRLEGIAEPGGVVVSAIARDALISRLDAEFRDLGELSLKNIARPVRAFQVMFGPTIAQTPLAPLRSKIGASPTPPARASIAVRPFTVLFEDRGLEFLANGLREDVTTLLARVPGFFVIFEGVVICLPRSRTANLPSSRSNWASVMYSREAYEARVTKSAFLPSLSKPRPAAFYGPASTRLCGPRLWSCRMTLPAESSSNWSLR